MRPQQWNVLALIVDRDHLAVDALFQRTCTSTGPNVITHESIRRIHRDVANHFRVGIAGHADNQWIIGVEHCAIFRDFHNDTFDFG